MRIEKRLQELGIQLIEPDRPWGNYLAIARVGQLAFVSGHPPKRADGTYVVGKVGRDVTVQEARDAARLTAIHILSTLKEQLGDLDSIVRIVKVVGGVNAVESFGDLPEIIDGFSEVLIQVFGEKGRHARVAEGFATLPGNIAVKMDMIIELAPS
jgi:enamine deaminase RidA (YjgF/YER057c/UK114 family)